MQAAFAPPVAHRPLALIQSLRQAAMQSSRRLMTIRFRSIGSIPSGT